MQTWPKRFLISFLILSGITACQQSLPDQTEDSGPALDLQVEEAPSNFVLAVKMANVPKDTLDAKFAALGVKAKTGVDIYRIYYMTTDMKNKPVKATGVVILPMIRIPVFPWISIQHYTITGESQAPSNKPEEGVFESSQGFITVIADQIGYGATTGNQHPYLFKNAYPKVLVDMLRASRTFIKANGLNAGPLFLRGYSEGAYATLALQKTLETQYATEFPLAGSAAGAGPYELEGTARASMGLPAVNPVNLSYLTLSYASYLAPEMDLSKIFALNVDDVKKTLNGSKTYEEALASLPTAPSALFKSDFMADFVQETPATAEAIAMRKFLKENSLFNDGWVPQTTTRFYHCKDDESVPYQLTEYAMAKITAAASSAPVSKVIMESPDPSKPYRHMTCPLYYQPVSFFGEILKAAQDAATASTP